MQVSLTAAAQSDLEEIEAYVGFDSRAAAGRIAANILIACTTLADFPNRGRRGARLGTRELVVGRHLITYRVLDTHVEVTRIRHHARRR